MLAARKGLFVDNPAQRPLGEMYVATFPDLQTFYVTQNLLLGITVPGA